MTLQPLWKGSELLHKLLADYLDGRADTQLFCDQFEQAFNQTDRCQLTPTEEAAFERLFNELVYFSPFADERATVPNYRSEAQIREAAEAAQKAVRTVG